MNFIRVHRVDLVTLIITHSYFAGRAIWLGDCWSLCGERNQITIVEQLQKRGASFHP